jgi:hypothetical protein
MFSKIFITATGLLAALAIGAGCVTNQPVVTDNSADNTTPVAANDVWRAPTTCVKDAKVTFKNSDDTMTKWEISLNGEVVKTLTSDGERAVDLFKEISGMTFLADNPSGLGGYIPYSGVEKIYGVDHCTGDIIEIVAPGNGLNTEDISDNGSLLAYINSDEMKTWAGIQTIGTAKAPYKNNKWLVPGDWSFGGSFKFNALASKIALAVGNMYESSSGPSREFGAIYVLNLTTGEFTKIAEKTDGLLYVDGWNGDQVIYR